MLIKILTFSLFTLVSTVAFGKSFQLVKSMIGEEKPNNEVWMEYATNHRGVQCKHWEKEFCNAESCPNCEKCVSCVVKYLDEQERIERKLTWNKAVKKWLNHSGTPYDSKEEAKRRNAQAVSKDERETMKHWKIDYVPSIWVMDHQGNLYVSAEQKPGRFHHSSFLGGMPVMSAGQIVLENGTITHINNASGHYKPDKSSITIHQKELHIKDASIIEFVPGSQLHGSETLIDDADSDSEGEEPEDFYSIDDTDDATSTP